VDFTDDFDCRLENILKIKSNFYDEACILIFVYLDYLCGFTEKKYDDNYHNKENFRHFLMMYSGKEDILKYIQIDQINALFDSSVTDSERYGHYLDKYQSQFKEIQEGTNLPITDFLSLDDVHDSDKGFFQKYTLANRLYDLRNRAVHEYRNNVYLQLDSNLPVVIFIHNIDKEKQGWYSILFSFEFLYEILMNCYEKVNKEYNDFIVKHFP